MIAGSVVEDYNPALSFGMSSGTYTTTTETHEVLHAVLRLLCLADRYGVESLVRICLQKMNCFPIGTKEVALLVQHIAGNIPESRADVYDFLMEQVYLHRPRLKDCSVFKSLMESEMSILGQGIMRLIIDAPTSTQVSRLFSGIEKGGKVAWCVEEVRLENCIATYGADDSYPIKFGAASAGEVFITNGNIDGRGIFCAQRDHGGPTLAFPLRSFVFVASTASP